MKHALPNQQDAVRERFQLAAAEILAQYLTVGQMPNKSVHLGDPALERLLGQIARRLARLSLAQRLDFFPSAVALVAEFLVANRARGSRASAVRPFRPRSQRVTKAGRRRIDSSSSNQESRRGVRRARRRSSPKV